MPYVPDFASYESPYVPDFASYESPWPPAPNKGLVLVERRETLRHLISGLNIFHEEIARALGVHPATLKGWLNERRNPRTTNSARALDTLGVLVSHMETDLGLSDRSIKQTLISRPRHRYNQPSLMATAGNFNGLELVREELKTLFPQRYEEKELAGVPTTPEDFYYSL